MFLRLGKKPSYLHDQLHQLPIPTGLAALQQYSPLVMKQGGVIRAIKKAKQFLNLAVCLATTISNCKHWMFLDEGFY